MSEHKPPSDAAPVPLAEPTGDRRGTDATRRILDDCRGIVDATLLDRAAEVLNEVVAAATRTREESQVRNARALALHARALSQAYRDGVHAAYDAAVAVFTGVRPASAGAGVALSLVDMGQSDLSSQIDQWAARVRGLVHEPLAAVFQRLQGLAPDAELPERHSPFAPALYFETLAHALQSVVPVPEELAALLRHLPAALAPELSATYEAIDRLLASRGLVPVLAGGGHRPVPPLRGAPETPALALQVTVPGGIEAGHADAPAQAPAPTGSAPVLRGARAGAHAPPAAPADPDDQPDVPGLAEYARLQAQLGINAAILTEAALKGAPADAAAPAAALVQAMYAAQRLDAEFVAAWVAPADAAKPRRAEVPERIGTREYGRRMVGLAVQPLHKITIQLVARLFTRLEIDVLVPEALRGLLGALRFPFLEVALVDPSVLVRADHPARRFLNAAGRTAVGWNDAGPQGPAYAQALRAAVQGVVRAPGGAPAAFADALESFTAFLAQQDASPPEALVKAREALRIAEERESRAVEIAALLRDVLEGAPLDDTLRRFVLEVWPRALVAAADREAQRPGRLRRLLDIVPDLVWSVQPGARGADRKRLAETIPTVLADLRAGLHLLRWPDDKVQELLDHLMPLHAAALALPEAGAAAPAPAAHGSFSASTVRIRLDGFQVEALAAPLHERPFTVLEEAVQHTLKRQRSGVSHRWVRSAQAPRAGAPDPAQAEAAIARWRPGTWFDLRIGTDRARVCLDGFTASHSLALFCPAIGETRYSLSHASLVTYLRRGWIAPVEPAPLLARAFRRTLADLKRSVEASGVAAGG